MKTIIGEFLISSRRRLAIATAIGLLIVAADIILVCWGHHSYNIQGRGALAVFGLAVYVRLVDGNLGTVGLRFTPIRGWLYWFRITVLLGLIILLFMLLFAGVLFLAGREIPVYTRAPDVIVTEFIRICLFTPVLEETTYRLILCVPLAVLLGPWWAIIVSGLVFGGLHVAYGIPAPTNLLAGYVLAWAFLKSGSIAIPVILHCLGNLFVLAMNVAAWYWLNT